VENKGKLILTKYLVSIFMTGLDNFAANQIFSEDFSEKFPKIIEIL